MGGFGGFGPTPGEPGFDGYPGAAGVSDSLFGNAGNTGLAGAMGQDGVGIYILGGSVIFYTPSYDLVDLGGGFYDLSMTYFDSSEAQFSFYSVEPSSFSFVTAIPEPSTYAVLLGIGTLGFAIWRRRRAR
jgi:PEP-CTERM putative exosortase interaction domain